jgi:hypothetical protein
MKASLTWLRSATGKLTILVTLSLLMTGVHPAISQANGLQNSQDQSLVFEVKLIPTENSIRYDHVLHSDPRFLALQRYLEERKSPLAEPEYVEQLLRTENLERIIAIVTIESSLCRFVPAKTYNCSGITNKNGKYQQFKDFGGWIDRMDELLSNKRYAGRTFEQMNCVYVQPCNPNWVRVTKKVHKDVSELLETAVLTDGLPLTTSLNASVIALN